MSPETSASLDDLLAAWHQWQKADQQTRGFASRSAGFENYRASRQHHLEDIEASTDNDRLRCVDFEVRQMQEPHRTAIYQDALHLNTGLSVWTSPRLPVDPEERQTLLSDARALICARLEKAGVM